MIKKLTITDYEEVVNLWQKSGLDIREKGRDHPARVQEQLESGNVALLGKVINKVIIGIVLVSHDNRKGWINRLAVQPSNRNEGIGKELLAAAEKYLLDRGIEVFGALIFSDNISSRRLFESSEYEQWEEVKYYSKRMRADS